jgi:hypothetical protein
LESANELESAQDYLESANELESAQDYLESANELESAQDYLENKLLSKLKINHKALAVGLQSLY